MRRKSNFLAATGMGIIEQRLAASRARYGKPMRDVAGHADPAPAPTPAPAPAPSPSAFEDAFKAALDEENPDGKPADPPAGDPPAGQEPGAPPAPAGDPPADGGAAPAPAAPAAPAGGGAPAAPTPPAQPETPPAPVSADDLVAKLTEALKQPAAPAADPAAPTPPAQPEAPLYTDAETAVLADFEKNWPDVAQAGRLERRAEYHDLLKFVFAQVQEFTKPLFEMQDSVRLIGNSLHMQELGTKVEGYSPELESQVNAWIDTQPSYLQPAMKQVMQTGTSDEVADLFGRYRAANPAAAPAPAAPAAPAPAAPAAAAPKTELSDAAKQAAASLAPVGGERSQVPQGEDPGDFESAFKKYAATMDS